MTVPKENYFLYPFLSLWRSCAEATVLSGFAFMWVCLSATSAIKCNKMFGEQFHCCLCANAHMAGEGRRKAAPVFPTSNHLSLSAGRPGPSPATSGLLGWPCFIQDKGGPHVSHLVTTAQECKKLWETTKGWAIPGRKDQFAGCRREIGICIFKFYSLCWLSIVFFFNFRICCSSSGLWYPHKDTMRRERCLGCPWSWGWTEIPLNISPEAIWKAHRNKKKHRRFKTCHLWYPGAI